MTFSVWLRKTPKAQPPVRAIAPSAGGETGEMPVMVEARIEGRKALAVLPDPALLRTMPSCGGETCSVGNAPAMPVSGGLRRFSPSGLADHFERSVAQMRDAAGYPAKAIQRMVMT